MAKKEKNKNNEEQKKDYNKDKQIKKEDHNKLDKETKIESKEKKIHFRRTKNFYNTYKKTFWTILVIVTVLLFFLGTKIVLYVNLMLGNDIILTLSTQNQEFNLKNGEIKNITFLASVKTNPFCKATCISTFEDLSKNQIIKNENFTITAQKPLKLNYNLKSDLNGNGQKLYRETIQCKSIETTICHTSGDYTTRTVLITLNHELNDEEKILKQSLNKTINDLKSDISFSFEIIQSINKTLKNITIELNELNYISTENKKLEKELISQNQRLFLLNKLWESEDYIKLNKEINTFQNLINSKSRLIELYSLLNSTLIKQNNMVDEYTILSDALTNISKLSFENISFVTIIESSILKYDLAKNEFELSKNLTSKNNSIDTMKRIVENLSKYTNHELNFEIDNRKNELNLNYMILCDLGADCIDTKFINDIDTIELACKEIENLNKLFVTINSTLININSSMINDSIKNDINNIKKQISDKTKKISNLSTLLDNKDLALYEFIQTKLTECKLNTINITLENALNYSFLNISTIEEFELNFTLKTQTDKCCVKGKCEECCKEGLCENKDYPLLFIHGHSFNKRLETDYSLDAFNKLQYNLENKNYINAGAISMYSPMDESEGLWQEIPKPLSIKVSYYYDIFKTQEDYVLIQTKSENIDTYALRLNDLINSILQKTDKKKVTIISHSMGGLVTRRYIQIFGGDKIDKFIMIATPNAGVTGAIADYCTLVGEQQECKDLKADSLFLNKLNRDNSTSNVDSYVIYGSGCDTNGKDGDGIVSIESAKLSYAKNIEIKGNCTTFNTLHTDLLNTDKYPKVYKEISKILN